MQINEIEKLENIKRIIGKYFNPVHSDSDKTEFYIAQIKINYYELSCVITNMIKMCVFTLDHDGHIKSSTNKNPINVSLVLEMVLEMFPVNEFDLLGEISEIAVKDSQIAEE